MADLPQTLTELDQWLHANFTTQTDWSRDQSCPSLSSRATPFVEVPYREGAKRALLGRDDAERELVAAIVTLLSRHAGTRASVEWRVRPEILASGAGCTGYARLAVLGAA
jgi:hypothetical protein